MVLVLVCGTNIHVRKVEVEVNENGFMKFIFYNYGNCLEKVHLVGGSSFLFSNFNRGMKLTNTPELLH